MTALDAALLVKYMVTNSIEYTIKSEHVIVADPGIISFDRREKMKIRPFAEFLDDTDRREAFVCDDDTALDKTDGVSFRLAQAAAGKRIWYWLTSQFRGSPCRQKCGCIRKKVCR